MDFMNATNVEAGWTMGFERDGRELVIVAIKATFQIPVNGQPAPLAEKQVPLTAADEFTGEPGLSAPLYETDYAHRKPRCDVLLNASAYAPHGKKCERVTVSAQIGSMHKTFDVVGNRVWQQGVFGYAPSQPEPFRQQRISYDAAFGGVDASHPNPDKLLTYLTNPVGRGYHPHLREVSGKPVPTTEQTGQPIKSPTGNNVPQALGPLGRSWQPRAPYAGTYDQAWLDNKAPFWPDDFDYHYFQAAPPDQQIPYPSGGEEVRLEGLSAQGSLAFQLPPAYMPVLFVPHRGEDQQVEAVIDTLVIEPDLQRFSVTWRASLPMRKSCFDLKQVIAGEMPREWYRARRTGNKIYYPNLEELIRARRR